jgi:prophage regulatory protein
MSIKVDRFLSRKQVLALINRSPVTLWRWTRAGIFPAPCKIGPRSVAWLESEIAAWQAERVAERDHLHGSGSALHDSQPSSSKASFTTCNLMEEAQ